MKNSEIYWQFSLCVCLPLSTPTVYSENFLHKFAFDLVLYQLKFIRQQKEREITFPTKIETVDEVCSICCVAGATV